MGGGATGPAAAAGGQGTRLTQEEALRLAFPAPAVVERRTAFLGEADLTRARELAGADVPVTRSVVSYYVAELEGRPAGAAYFDAHRVRSMREVVMVVVDPRGRVARVEIVAFGEPPEYLARAGWLEQLVGEPLDRSLSLKGSIVNMTGATLTAQAVVRATRRVLALHAVIRPFRDDGSRS